MPRKKKPVANFITKWLAAVRPTAWIALIAGLALIIALSSTLTTLYNNLELEQQIWVIAILIVVLSFTGFQAISVRGILKDVPK